MIDQGHRLWGRAKSIVLENGMEEPPKLSSKEKYLAGETTAYCEKHGEFEVQAVDLVGHLMVQGKCGKCVGELHDAIEGQVKLLLKKEEEEEFRSAMKSAGVSERHFDKTFDSYIADTKEKQFALDSMKYFAEKVIEGECKNMILCGSVGTGKTHLCNALVRYLLEHNVHMYVRMATITQIIRFYRSSWNKDSELTEEEAIGHLSKARLLVIDELGIQVGSDNELNIIFEIINNRYEKRLPTVIISNLEKAEVVELLGTRIIDRLKEDGCRVLGMSWESYRETNKESF